MSPRTVSTGTDWAAVEKQIEALVRDSPGVSMRSVSGKCGLPVTSVSNTLNELESKKRIKSLRDGNRKRYYHARVKLATTDRKILHLLQEPRTRELIEFILDYPDYRGIDLSQALKCPQPTITYTIKKLDAAGILRTDQVGVDKYYRIKNAAKVRSLIKRLKK